MNSGRGLREVALPFVRPEWQHDGLCNGADQDVFFPSKGISSKPAQRICGRCPVAEPCLEYALDNRIHDGVWGGQSVRARKKLLRVRSELAAQRIAS